MSGESSTIGDANCSERVFGEDQTLNLRGETRLPSCFWTQTDVDKLFHRFKSHTFTNTKGEIPPHPKYWKDDSIHHFGMAEIKFCGRQIDDRTRDKTGDRIRSQYDTISRLLRFINSGKHGNIDRRLPGVSGDWNGRSWDVFHGLAGIELSGKDPKDSEITWARPTPARLVTSGGFHLPAAERTVISYDTLIELLSFTRSWDDPSKQIGHMGVGTCKGERIDYGLRLSSCGSVWLVGDKNSMLRHPR